MRKRFGIMTMAALACTGAQAISDGQGGYVYWSAGQYSGAISNFAVYRLELGADWSIATPKTKVTDVAANSLNTYASWSEGQRRNSLAVRDPRHLGGTGKLLQITHRDPFTQNGVPSNRNYLTAWDLIEIDPADGWAQTVLCDGVYLGTGDQPYNSTACAGQPLTVPENWGGRPTHGLSFAMLKQSGDYHGVVALYDRDGDGTINDHESPNHELTSLQSSRLNKNTQDAEIGVDGAAYYTSPVTGTVGQWTYYAPVYRVTANGSFTVFFRHTGSGNPVSTRSETMGLAAGPVHTASGAPIMYLSAMDTGTVDNANTYISVFALVDGDNDGSVSFSDPDDRVVRVWRAGMHGVLPNQHDHDAGYAGGDLEYYRNPQNNGQFLVAGNRYGQLWVIELASDGLSSISAKWISSVVEITNATPPIYGAGPASVGNGFELDMNDWAKPSGGTAILIR